MRTHLKRSMTALGCCLTLALLIGLFSSPARAQFNGHNFRGDFGLQVATQPDPGWYLSAVYLRYEADKLRDRDGNEIGSAAPGSVHANGYSLGLWRVTNIKIFGANYSFMLFPGLTDNKFEVPILGVNEPVDLGITDIYVQPINLGWHNPRTDYMAGLGIYAPTGSYEVGADDNLGLGMWSFELFGGTTVYFDEAKSWHFAAAAYYEIHSKKKDTDIRVGDILTLEGGLGKSFMGGALSVGVAYFGQWKVTDDSLGANLQDLEDIIDLLGGVGKNRVYGVGPELLLPIATKKRYYGSADLRFLWDFGAVTQLEGKTFLATFSFPIPSVAL